MNEVSDEFDSGFDSDERVWNHSENVWVHFTDCFVRDGSSV